MKDKPLYNCKPIGSVAILAKSLGIDETHLRNVAQHVGNSYTTFTVSNPGKRDRDVFDPKINLKRIQKRINSRIFSKVSFPEYLQGGIKSRDYVTNADIHSHAHSLINLDVKNFFPNIKVEDVNKIFKYFFKFPDSVSEILTQLTTLNGKLPQGACTSSYLANLVFFNEEYHLVSKLRGQSIQYSRLMDDVTISSRHKLSGDKSSELIKLVAAMLKKHNLRLNKNKIHISHRDNPMCKFEVTGLWIKHENPKVRKKERRYVRQLVYNCEKDSKVDRTSDDYHKLWNRTSGLVAKLERLGHPQAAKYRNRLSVIMPEYDVHMEFKITKLVQDVLRVPKDKRRNLGVIRRVNEVKYKLGILGRTNKKKSKYLRRQLTISYPNLLTKSNFWEV